jgi:hypothetical protein
VEPPLLTALLVITCLLLHRLLLRARLTALFTVPTARGRTGVGASSR